MGTRIGKFIFEDNLVEMSIEKLEVLSKTCNAFIKERHRTEIHKALTEINLRAHSYGFDIAVKDVDGNETYLNEMTLQIEDRE